MSKLVVAALGGNAILQPGQEGRYEDQVANIERACEQLVTLVEDGHQLVIVHGNGPQVGNLLVQNDMARSQVPAMPLDVLGAQSQGMIGYMIERAMRNVLRRHHIEKPVAVLVSMVEVSPNDPAFQNPVKPVGLFYSEDDMQRIRKPGECWKEQFGRGWRKVVPSPKPAKVLESNLAKRLVAENAIVVTGGGGGISVAVDDANAYRGLEAVIDKDLTAAILATEMNADLFMILTDVEGVMLNYRQPSQKMLSRATTAEMHQYIAEGHFAPGSMLSKVEACCMFCESTGNASVIASLYQAFQTLNGMAGTRITIAR